VQYVGETFLFPVVRGRSIAAPTKDHQRFYPCNGATVPVRNGQWESLTALAYALGVNIDDPRATVTMPNLLSPVPGLVWFISNTGVFPTGGVDVDDVMPLLGQISIFSAPFGRVQYHPAEVLPCDGRTIPMQDNWKLFHLLGSTFGGDGVTNFGLPNLPVPGPGMFFGMCAGGDYPELVPYEEVPG
jgi:Phage Tail Collar Domain